VLVLNKMDQVDEKQKQVLSEVCQSLNPKSSTVAVEFGKVVVGHVLRDDAPACVADAFGDDDHQRAVQMVREENKRKEEEEAKAKAEVHDHGHGEPRPQPLPLRARARALRAAGTSSFG
jgi:G3E family GTPase